MHECLHQGGAWHQGERCFMIPSKANNTEPTSRGKMSPIRGCRAASRGAWWERSFRGIPIVEFDARIVPVSFKMSLPYTLASVGIAAREFCVQSDDLSPFTIASESLTPTASRPGRRDPTRSSIKCTPDPTQTTDRGLMLLVIEHDCRHSLRSPPHGEHMFANGHYLVICALRPMFQAGRSTTNHRR